MDKKKERPMTQKEIDKAFEKMCKAYESKGVDFDTRRFVLDVKPPQVLFIKSEGGDFSDEFFIHFTKNEPVKPRDFKLEDYPQKVQDILKELYDTDNLGDDPYDPFPNIIATPFGEDLLDAIENMTRMSILLDHGWGLFSDDYDYQLEHEGFFGSDEEDSDEDDWDDDDEEEEEDEK